MTLPDKRASEANLLAHRARLLRELRTFFDEEGFLEVETPLLAGEIIAETHIEPISLAASAALGGAAGGARELWLQPSPELAMKRLLVAGLTAIYQVTHAFRAQEVGALHRPEFTMVEWYRAGENMSGGISRVEQLVERLLHTRPARRTSYGRAFLEHAGVDPFHASVAELRSAAAKLQIPSAANESSRSLADDRDEWLNLLLAYRVERQLGRDQPEIIFDYPASQAALATIRDDGAGPPVASRFELYWQGVELANGYDELTDADELRRRLESVNRQRRARGRRTFPLPQRLLAAMEQGLPPSTGVALGFDRLVMLANRRTSIGDSMAWGNDLAEPS